MTVISCFCIMTSVLMIINFQSFVAVVEEEVRPPMRVRNCFAINDIHFIKFDSKLNYPEGR